MLRHKATPYIALFLAGFFLAGLLFAPDFAFANEPTRYAPGNYLTANAVAVYADKVVIDVEQAVWAEFADTGSMEPLFNEDAHALQYRPEGPHDIQVGDVVSYYNAQGLLIVHRVIARDDDKQGVYYLLQGDNNPVMDPQKVRYEDIYSVVFAVLY